MKYYIVFPALLAMLTSRAQIRGAHVRAELVTGYTYSISVTVITDVKSSAKQIAQVKFGDNVSGGLALQAVSLWGNAKVAVYTGTHTYPGPGAYNIVYADSAWTKNIRNIPASHTTLFGVRTTVNITPFTGMEASTPKVVFLPLLAGTAGQPISYQGGYLDEDGDSLSYRLMTPFAPAYNPAGVSIDESSGEFTFANDTAGLYAFTIEIAEFRKNTSGFPVQVGKSELAFVADLGEPTGVGDGLTGGNDLRLFPNPTNASLGIRMSVPVDGQWVEILNAVGETVWRTRYKDSLDVSRLPAGVYFIRIRPEQRTPLAARFVKQ